MVKGQKGGVMTKWEIGQILIAINDDIADKIYDLNQDGHKRLAIKLDLIRAQVGDLFNEDGNSDHAFGVFDSGSLVDLILKNQEK